MLNSILVKCTADVCCTETSAQSGPSRVTKLVKRYSALGSTLSSPLDEITSSTRTARSRDQSPVPEVVGDGEVNENEG